MTAASSLETTGARLAAARRSARIRWRRRQHPPVVLLATGLAVVGLLVLPLVYLGLQASEVGWAHLSHLLFRSLTAELLGNTVKLLVVVTVLTGVLGMATAWCIERTTLPGRRLWAVLVLVPLAIPDFVRAYTWASITPSVRGLEGASLVMTFGLFPLVYLPVAAALRRVDPAQEEAARALGNGRWRVFLRVTLPQIRPALFGGCLLVALTTLAEFGTFEIMSYQTFTTEIFTEYKDAFDPAAAAGLSVVLVLICVIVLGGEMFASGRMRGASRRASRPPDRIRLGWRALPVLLGFAALIGVSAGEPASTVVYWMTRPARSTLPGTTSLLGAAWSTLGYAFWAAVLATVCAMPVALLVVRHRSRASVLLERSTYLAQSLPGLVVALSMVFFSIHYIFQLYQSSLLLVITYAVLFFPLALVSVRASVAQAPQHLEEVARALGKRPLTALVRVTVPLVAPGLGAAFCLVFLTAATELTATLILVPTGTQTLATQFWAYQANTSYSAAAPYAAALILIAGVPSLALGRWFDRLPESPARSQ